MRDVISSYSGKGGGNHLRVVVYLSIVFLVFVALTYVLYKPWVTDFAERADGRHVFSFVNTGNLKDDDIAIEMNSSSEVECSFNSNSTLPRQYCTRDTQARSAVLIKCNFLAPGQDVNVSCEYTEDPVFLNFTMKSKYQFVRRHYLCEWDECREDTNVYSGTTPSLVSYLFFYWGERLLDLTNWLSSGGDVFGMISGWMGFISGNR